MKKIWKYNNTIKTKSNKCSGKKLVTKIDGETNGKSVILDAGESNNRLKIIRDTEWLQELKWEQN